MKQFILNRTGVVRMDDASSNQCFTEGWSNYEYHIKITAGTTLDEEGFVIDHGIIHAAVVDVFKKATSCEKICLEIDRTVAKKIKEHGADLKKIEIKVAPWPVVEPFNRAYMEFEAVYA